MLQCTPIAAAALAEVRRQRDLPEGYGLRFAPSLSAEGEIGLSLLFTDAPREGDRISQQYGATLIVAPELSDELDHLVLDVIPDLGVNGDRAPQLVLRPDDPD